MSNAYHKYNWGDPAEQFFDNYATAREYVIAHYTVAELFYDIEHKRKDYFESSEQVDKFYAAFGEEIRGQLPMDAAFKLAAAEGITHHEDIKKFHVNHGLKLIVEDLYNTNKELLDQHSTSFLHNLIDVNVLGDWCDLSQHNFTSSKDLKSFILNHDKGQAVVGAINLIKANAGQTFVGEADAIRLLATFPRDINSQKNYDQYSERVMRNLCELVTQMANASIREAYLELYAEHEQAIINYPQERLVDVVGRKPPPQRPRSGREKT